MTTRQVGVAISVAAFIAHGALAQAPFAPSGQTLVVPANQVTLPVSLETLSLTPKPPNAPPLSFFGQGYDSATGKILLKICVPMVGLVAKGGAFTAGTGQHYFDEVTSLTDVLSTSSTSASASLLYDGFTGSASGSVVNGSFASSFGRYVVAYSRVITGEWEARGTGRNGDPELDPLLLQDVKKPEVFRPECGDHFISGYQIGGVLSVVAAVKSNQDKDWKANSVNVGLGFADVFNANFSQASSHEKFKSSSMVSLRDFSQGYRSGPPTLENLYDTYTGYDAKAAATPGLVTFVLTPYPALGPVAAAIPDFTALEETMLDQLARRRDIARTRRNDLDDAMKAQGAHLTLFSIDTDANQALMALDDYLDSIANASDACRKAVKADDCTTAIKAVLKIPVPPSHVAVAP